MRIIGIAGGSGSGKSTVSYALIDQEPEVFEILNLDDYQRLKSEPNLPMLAGMINWDHPDIIRWNDLIANVQKLREGDTITIDSWAHRSNPDYAHHGQMTARTITPKPVLIVEGYLALYNATLNQFFDQKIYLDLDAQTRSQRRDKGTLTGDAEYQVKVLEPMFQQFVEPTRLNADIIIDVSAKTIAQVAQTIRTAL